LPHPTRFFLYPSETALNWLIRRQSFNETNCRWAITWESVALTLTHPLDCSDMRNAVDNVARFLAASCRDFHLTIAASNRAAGAFCLADLRLICWPPPVHWLGFPARVSLGQSPWTNKKPPHKSQPPNVGVSFAFMSAGICPLY